MRYRCFTGTHSRIKGADFTAIFNDLLELHTLAYPRHTDVLPQLSNPGQFHLRNGGEAHLNTPEGMVALQQVVLESYNLFCTFTFLSTLSLHLLSLYIVYEQLNFYSFSSKFQWQASKTNSRDAFKTYTIHVDKMNRAVTLRGVIKLKYPKSSAAIPLDEVQSAAEIVKRFNTGAMSLGSISQETHETLAVAMNQIGARSNTG